MPTPKFASLQEILLEGGDTESGVVAEAVEERLDVEARRVLIDFFERFLHGVRRSVRSKGLAACGQSGF